MVNGGGERSFGTAKASIQFYVELAVQQDILIQFRHITSLHGSEPMFHFVFNVGMLCPLRTGPTHQSPTFPSGSPFQLVVPKNDLEKAQKDHRFPPDFSLVLQFEELDIAEERQLMPSPDDIEALTSLWRRRVDPLDPLFPLPGLSPLLSPLPLSRISS